MTDTKIIIFLLTETRLRVKTETMQLKSLITLGDVVAWLGYVTMLVHRTTWDMFQHA